MGPVSPNGCFSDRLLRPLHYPRYKGAGLPAALRLTERPLCANSAIFMSIASKLAAPATYVVNNVESLHVLCSVYSVLLSVCCSRATVLVTIARPPKTLLLLSAIAWPLQEMVPTLLGSVAPPSMTRRNWFIIAVATPAVLASLLYMYRNRYRVFVFPVFVFCQVLLCVVL